MVIRFHVFATVLAIAIAVPLYVQADYLSDVAGSACIVVVQGNENLVKLKGFHGCGKDTKPPNDSFTTRSLFIHYKDNENYKIAVSTAEEFGSLFGFTLIREVNVAPAHATIRFFYDFDEGAAKRLVNMLNQAARQNVWSSVNFGWYDPKPRPGLLEMWIPDQQSPDTVIWLNSNH